MYSMLKDDRTDTKHSVRASTLSRRDSFPHFLVKKVAEEGLPLYKPRGSLKSFLNKLSDEPLHISNGLLPMVGT